MVGGAEDSQGHPTLSPPCPHLIAPPPPPLHSRTAPGEALPEALAKLDPALVENVCSEVMDSGGQLGE